MIRAAYLCRCGPGIGWGHLARGTALLEAPMFAGSDLFVAGDLDGGKEWVRRATSSSIGFRCWSGDRIPAPLQTAEYDLGIVDDYAVPNQFLTECRRWVPLMLVDDWKRRRPPVEILLNPNIGAHPRDYRLPSGCLALCGERFALIRRSVREAGGAVPRKNEILLTLGGSDPDGRTARIATELVETDWFVDGGRLVVVLGGGYQGPEPWQEDSWAQGGSFVLVREPVDFLDRARRATVIVCGASTTSYELATLRAAFIPLAFVENQRRINEEWQRHGIGARFDVRDRRWAETITQHVIQLVTNDTQREVLARRGSRLIDGCGAGRVAKRLLRSLKQSRSERANLGPGRQ